MLYRRHRCHFLFLFGLLIALAPIIRVFVDKINITDLKINNMTIIEKKISPDTRHYVNIFSSGSCNKICKKVYVVLSENCENCSGKKRIMLFGYDMVNPSIKWLDDNEIQFSYSDGLIENAVGIENVLMSPSTWDASIFLKIKNI